LSSIQRDEVRKLHLAIGGILSATTANHVADLVNILFHKATDWGEFSGQSPAENLQLFPEVSRARFLQPGELPAFWQALDEEHSEDYRDLVLLSILAGGRSGNTRAMKWSDIDMEACVWRIPDSESKNKAMLTIVLVPEAMEVLTRRRDAEGASPTWVFPAKSEAGHVSNQPKKWHALLARAGLKELRFHDLRRSLGSWQARTGASLLIIGKSLGHKSQQATQIYAQLDTDPVRQSVERATAAMINGRVPNQNGKVVALPGVTVDLPAENLAKQA
jgi:integrase